VKEARFGDRRPPNGRSGCHIGEAVGSYDGLSAGKCLALRVCCGSVAAGTRDRWASEGLMQLKFYTLDVFTMERFAGNPLAVVMGADGLDTAAMQTITREFNLSETVFVQKADNAAHSAKIRIFTPASELPFAGHPTVGTAALLAQLRMPDVRGEQDAIVVLEEKIGTVRVGVKLRGGQPPHAEFDAPKLPENLGKALDPELLAEAMGIQPSEIGFANHRPSRFTAGVPYNFLPVASLAVIARAEVQSQRWAEAFGSPKAGNMALYCRETIHNTASFHARVFFPGAGLTEDPATGSAAAAFAGVVHHFDGLRDGSHKRIIEQGYEMGRPSQIELGMEVQGASLTTVRIGGAAVRVSQGEITI
jgi:trans-2,3-dihydro-3-hydroxyanthranilate isomerase